MNRIHSSKSLGVSLFVIISIFCVSCSKDTATLLEEGKVAFYSKEYVKAKNAFLECANRGDSQGQFWLALLTNQVHGHYSDTDTLDMSIDDMYKYVFDLYKKSAGQNDGDGYYGLYSCYLLGRGVEENTQEAIKYLDKSVELGSSWGYAVKGRALVTGDFGVTDVTKGMEYLKKSVKAENYLGISFLGELYVAGIAVKVDVDKGLELLEEGANHGETVANDALAQLYRFGLGMVEQDRSLAFKYAKEGSYGNAISTFIVAEGYYYGDVVEQNRDLGIKLAYRAAQSDYDNAKSFWAEICEDGYGTKMEAFEYFMKAAELGHVYATAKVGEYLLKGTAGKTDYSLAKKYLMKAASEGSEDAQKLLSTYSGILEYY